MGDMFNYDREARRENYAIFYKGVSLQKSFDMLCMELWKQFEKQLTESGAYDRALALGLEEVTVDISGTEYDDILDRLRVIGVGKEFKLITVVLKSKILSYSLDALLERFGKYETYYKEEPNFYVKYDIEEPYALANWDTWVGMKRTTLKSISNFEFTGLPEYTCIRETFYKKLVDSGFDFGLLGDRTLVVKFGAFEFIRDFNSWPRECFRENMLFVLHTKGFLDESMKYKIFTKVMENIKAGKVGYGLIVDSATWSFLRDERYLYMYEKCKKGNVYLYLSAHDYDAKNGRGER